MWFQNRRARLRRQAKRKASSSPSDGSSAESGSRQMQSSPASSYPEASTTETILPSPPASPNSETVPMTSQRCTQACCSPPPIICTSASCSSCPPAVKFGCPSVPSYGLPHQSTNFSCPVPSYGLPQQYYGGAFTYACFPPPQYPYYYRQPAYTSVSSAYQGNPICSVPKLQAPVARVEPVINVVDVCQ